MLTKHDVLNYKALIWGHSYEQMDEISLLAALESVIRNSVEDTSGHILLDYECNQCNWNTGYYNSQLHV